MKLRGIATVLAVSTGFVLSGCGGAAPSAESVVFGIDGSRSAEGTARTYYAGIANWLVAHGGQNLHVTAVGLHGKTGDTETCPTVTGDIVAEGNNDDVKTEDRHRKEQRFLAQVAQLSACLDANRSTSDLAAFETIKNAVGGGGTAVLFTDGMIYTGDTRIERRTLTDPAADAKVLSQFQSGARIDGVTVEIRGAGKGADLTDAELAGLHRRWERLVAEHGGSLSTFTSAIV